MNTAVYIEWQLVVCIVFLKTNQKTLTTMGVEINGINSPWKRNQTITSSAQLPVWKRAVYQTQSTQYLSAWGSVVFVIGMIILSWSLTGAVSMAILRNRRAKHISYLYIVSMNVATIIHASLNFPSSVIFDIFSKSNCLSALDNFWRGSVNWLRYILVH